MAKRWPCRALLACAILCAGPAAAEADWYFTPFFGWDLAGNTSLVDLEYVGANRTKVTFGGSAALIIGIVGFEADYAFVPRFFQNPRLRDDPNPLEGPTLTGSHIQMLTGNVILAAPLVLTQESLRPYLVGGAGWIGASSEYILRDFSFDCNMTAVNVGGGAIGMLGNRAGLRFDLRRFSGVGRAVASCPTPIDRRRLNFWRVTVGVTLRY